MKWKDLKKRMGLGNGKPPKVASESPEDTIRLFDVSRTERKGPGRRDEDVTIREVLRSQSAIRILSAGLAIGGMAFTFMAGKLTAFSNENEALRANNMALFQRNVTDDTKEKIDNARRAATEALANSEAAKQQVKGLETKMDQIMSAFNKLTAELKKERTDP